MNNPRVNLSIESNLGYGADQIERPMSLGDLLEAVQDAIDEWGEDAEVVIHQINNRYGANFGQIVSYDVFERSDEDSEDY